ncbi:uncharacterized protein LOC108037022 [Drosophila rhopaloa]|uniref:Uncharacterized protein LOC108037022 n=1 Tax=Drosophila rhopaloa TaxID=1041015 RepID=A0A6P4E1A1_DRORH|nr:uncharacterized protein LOC108037022 [Drosophila rhopaloa]
MKVSAAITIVILMFLGMAIALPNLHHVRFGMDEFWPLSMGNATDVLPLSTNLTQIQRLRWADKCVQFRNKCSMAEHCCSLRCLKRVHRCIT